MVAVVTEAEMDTAGLGRWDIAYTLAHYSPESDGRKLAGDGMKGSCHAGLMLRTAEAQLRKSQHSRLMWE